MTIALVLATVLVTARQEQAAPPPELKALSFMMGDFSSDMKMYQPGSDQGIPLVGSITTKETMRTAITIASAATPKCPIWL